MVMAVERAKRVKAIFDSSTKDLTYISTNESLLQEHIDFINSSRYVFLKKKGHLTTLTVDKTGRKTPKPFDCFKTLYYYIYLRWNHIIRSCYDKNYPTYKYFGARGIKVSDEFLDGKYFCIWCLKNHVVTSQLRYDKYIVRKDKSKGYSPENCVVMSEKEIHQCKDVKLALLMLYLIRKYESDHDPSVGYMAFYTRYFMYDFSVEDACSIKYIPTNIGVTYGFAATAFYVSVADENCCSLTTFLSRMHDAYLMPKFKIRPYDMLKPDYSTNAEARKQGLQSYKEQWDKRDKDRKSKNNQNSSTENNANNPYSYGADVNVYSNTNEVYHEDFNKS